MNDLSKCANYEQYKQELQAWECITDLAKGKQGIAVALSLPQEGEFGFVREKVFDELSLEELKKKTGLKDLIEFLNETLGKDDLAYSLEKFKDFDEYTRENEQSMSDFITKFDRKYNKIAKLGMTLPSQILAFRLLKKAKLSREEHMLVLTGMNFSEKDTLYQQAKKSLVKFKGEQVGGRIKSSEVDLAVNVEPAIEVESNVLWTGRYQGNRGGDRGHERGQRGYQSHGSYRSGHYSGQAGAQKTSVEKALNLPGPDGKPRLCHSCGSYRHLIANCPDKYENINVVEERIQQDNTNEEDVNVALFTGLNEVNITWIGAEAQNSAVLDSACTSIVCRQEWFDRYQDHLQQRGVNIKASKSDRVYQFGGGEILQSKGTFMLPASLAGHDITIETDVVDSEMPLLLSSRAMKRARVKLDLENDTAEILGAKVNLSSTSSGHYCVSLEKETGVKPMRTVKHASVSKTERRRLNIM